MMRAVHRLLSPAGLASLRSFDRGRALIALDFDGTLAPLVRDPDAVSIPPDIFAPLEALAATRAVAVISGRSLADLIWRVPVQGLQFFGNHGIENGPGWPASGPAYRSIAARWCEQLIAAGVSTRKHSGVWLEDKHYSLVIHFHGEADQAQRLRGVVERLDPAPRVIPGSAILNLVPEGAPGKGDALALAASRAGCTAAIYVGDDHTDEDAFSAVHLPVFALRVGHTEVSGAGFYLEDQRDVGAFLRELEKISV